ncbi:hypothetical protein D9757_012417 [Collybiopsis confluens]|uniref:Uncharacterized protein n=1 Tax=Collybiopsis confluens TaxID=2823264 RepID=A0A8H5H059_9AGAR|nr:hypothetical protein D9757_012417 [Collybiopsis confluens]
MVKNNMAQISLQSLKEGIGIMPVISLKYGANHSKAWHTNSPANALPPRLWSNPIAYIQHMLLSYTAAAKAGLERSAWFQKEGRGCYSEQSTQPQTPGYSLTDSPECEWMMRLQDIPDQSAIARQYTRYTAQINIVQVVALALQIATTEPKGPVFLCSDSQHLLRLSTGSHVCQCYHPVHKPERDERSVMIIGASRHSGPNCYCLPILDFNRYPPETECPDPFPTETRNDSSSEGHWVISDYSGFDTETE